MGTFQSDHRSVSSATDRFQKRGVERERRFRQKKTSFFSTMSLSLHFENSLKKPKARQKTLLQSRPFRTPDSSPLTLFPLLRMAAPYIDVIAASLRSCSLSGGASTLSPISSDPASVVDATDTTLELNSELALPYHWEQCLDLKVPLS